MYSLFVSSYIRADIVRRCRDERRRMKRIVRIELIARFNCVLGKMGFHLAHVISARLLHG